MNNDSGASPCLWRLIVENAPNAFWFFCGSRIDAGLKHCRAKGGSFQARPGAPAMRITSWLSAFMPIHTDCVKLGEHTGQTADPPFSTCRIILLSWKGGSVNDRLSVTTKYNRGNNGQRLGPSKWMEMNVSSHGPIEMCFFWLKVPIWIKLYWHFNKAAILYSVAFINNYELVILGSFDEVIQFLLWSIYTSIYYTTRSTW